MEEEANDNSELRWEPDTRIVRVAYKRGAKLTVVDGDFLVAAIQRWAGAQPFGLLADAGNLSSTERPYRARVSDFFRRVKDRGYIAVFNVGPVIGIVADMVRIGSGIQLETFRTEDDARAWLHKKVLR